MFFRGLKWIGILWGVALIFLFPMLYHDMETYRLNLWIFAIFVNGFNLVKACVDKKKVRKQLLISAISLIGIRIILY